MKESTVKNLTIRGFDEKLKRSRYFDFIGLDSAILAELFAGFNIKTSEFFSHVFRRLRSKGAVGGYILLYDLLEYLIRNCSWKRCVGLIVSDYNKTLY